MAVGWAVNISRFGPATRTAGHLIVLLGLEFLLRKWAIGWQKHAPASTRQSLPLRNPDLSEPISCATSAATVVFSSPIFLVLFLPFVLGAYLGAAQGLESVGCRLLSMATCAEVSSSAPKVSVR
jgi:hypothetical protein